ncbi:MAG: methionine adenosyltransferase [Pseudoclavibacter sp.]
MSRLITSESVTEGHPDKVADIVSDALVDAYLEADSDSRVAVETAVKDGLVLLAGEVSAPVTLDHVAIARQAIRDIGYTTAESGIDPDGAGVINNIRPRVFDNSTGDFGDTDGLSKDDAYNTFGGDQGVIIGYASDDTKAYLPLPIAAANQLTLRLARARHDGTVPLLRPDGKVLVTVEYDERLHPLRFHTVLVSAQHRPDLPLDELRAQVRAEVVEPVLAQYDVPSADANIVVNRATFIGGGPKADAGVTGRKIIVDTYGGFGGHGGGAFSGKDPRKPDRSAAYGARWAAKNIVAAGLARRARVALGYLWRTAQPVSIDVETYGTETVDRERIQRAVERTFDFRQLAIIDRLDLRRPIYRPTAAGGHFGRDKPDFTWERTDRVEELRANL